MLRISELMVNAEPGYSDEIDRILDSEPKTVGSPYRKGYILYLDQGSKLAVFEDENDKILIDTTKMITYEIIWDEVDGWVTAE